METTFHPRLRPALIGSLPMKDHQEATQLVFDWVPEIPLWPQLPLYPAEGMVAQFLPGFPGVKQAGDKLFVDSQADDFEGEMLQFYEDFLAVTEGGADPDDTRFAMDRETAEGFFVFVDQAAARAETLLAAKRQVTGPFTFA